MRFPLTLAVCVTSSAVWADSAPQDQCLVKIPDQVRVSEQPLDETDPAIRVQADRSDAQTDAARFEGNVRLTQGARRIRTESAEVRQLEGTFSATGGLVYEDPSVVISADSLNADVDDNQARLDKAQYWLNGQQVHGTAESLQIDGEDSLLLTGATFTTCPQDDPDWLLEAKTIAIDAEEEWGQIWNAKVKIFDVPVFYVPYMTVPVSDKRKTGFLFPNISTSSKNGIDLAAPFYWNIAPNYDMTLTTQYMSARGLFLQTEGRYLQDWGAGRVNLEYIGSDRLVDDAPERWLLHFDHGGKLDENWRLYGNYTKVSDDNYFNDFSSSVQASTDNQISREGEASYYTDNWNAAIRVQDIEVLGDSEKPFQVMPSLSLNYHQPDLYGPVDFAFSTELTHFAHKRDNHLTATRWHVEPTLTLPYQAPAGSLTSELKLMQTFYEQRDPNDQLEDFVSRTLPQFRLHGQVNLERDMTYRGDRYLQVLEPQFQYLYIPYEDQSDIGLYDTALLQEDYYGLFRDRRYSGLDRISDANQLTLGLATRFLDDGNRERAQISLGQIFFFSDPRVTLGEEETMNRSNSALAADLQLQASDHWFLRGGIQFDTESGHTNKSELLLDYRLSDNRLLQFSHRYVPDLGTDVEGNSIDINQAGVRASWPLTDEIYFVGNWYYDLNLDRSVENYAGVQYESCCWAIRLAYHRHLNTNYDDVDFTTINPRDDFDSGVSLKFVLKGLGSTGPLGVTDMLNEGLFNYRKPYYLRN
ncbi:LPS assembly protein LptD [Ferrimonas marina]|uniref:LPS-assembly protein LptD n=1 Tax=Ferrimonas marina TaxID=299255 RepID=A0A1M5ZKH8_9GAMM|nr:LPS assembly protein LptD [Ferrimonas marina]SHI24855.1 LPS-assembly protein [Ferrimonas marina]